MITMPSGPKVMVVGFFQAYPGSPEVSLYCPEFTGSPTTNVNGQGGTLATLIDSVAYQWPLVHSPQPQRGHQQAPT